MRHVRPLIAVLGTIAPHALANRLRVTGADLERERCACRLAIRHLYISLLRWSCLSLIPP